MPLRPQKDSNPHSQFRRLLYSPLYDAGVVMNLVVMLGPYMVAEAGVEPARTGVRCVLSAVRLPISPLGLDMPEAYSFKSFGSFCKFSRKRSNVDGTFSPVFSFT